MRKGYIKNTDNNEYYLSEGSGTTSNKNKAHIYDESYFKENCSQWSWVTFEQIEEKEVLQKTDFQKITSSIADLLEYKDKKYGQAALKPLKIFKGKTKVGDRLDDKLSRVKNNKVLQKNDVADIIGYLVLVCKENNWNDFSEFKD